MYVVYVQIRNGNCSIFLLNRITQRTGVRRNNGPFLFNSRINIFFPKDYYVPGFKIPIKLYLRRTLLLLIQEAAGRNFLLCPIICLVSHTYV